MKPTIIAALLILSGCASLGNNWLHQSEPRLSAAEQADRELIEKVQFAQFNEPYPKTRFETIQITSDKPAAKHVEIGLLTTQGSDLSDLTEFMKMRAANLGANAISEFSVSDIAIGTENRKGIRVSIGNGENSPDNSKNFRYEKKVSGIAIRFVK